MNREDYTWLVGDECIESLAKDQRFKDLIAELVDRNIVEFSHEEGEPLVNFIFSSEGNYARIEVVGLPSGPEFYNQNSVDLISLINGWVENEYGLDRSTDDYKSAANALSRYLGALADRMYEHDSLYLDFNSSPLQNNDLSEALISAHKILRGGGPKESIFHNLQTSLINADVKMQVMENRIKKLRDR